MPDVDDTFDEPDPQDSAETFDEDNLDLAEERNEMRTFEELPDLLDVTQAEGDRDEDEGAAMDAADFDEDAIGDEDLEDDNELDYRAATEEQQDDLDGLGPEDGFNEDRVARGQVSGLDQVEDASQVEGGEDDVSDFQSSGTTDADLRAMGYSEIRDGETKAKR